LIVEAHLRAYVVAHQGRQFAHAVRDDADILVFLDGDGSDVG